MADKQGGGDAQGFDFELDRRILNSFTVPRLLRAYLPDHSIFGRMMAPSGPVNTCVARTLYAAIDGATLGLLLYQLMTGVEIACQLSGNNPSLRPTAKGVLRMAGQYARLGIKEGATIWALLFGINCTMAKARGRQDWINAAVPGAVIGYMCGAKHGTRPAIFCAAEGDR